MTQGPPSISQLDGSMLSAFCFLPSFQASAELYALHILVLQLVLERLVSTRDSLLLGRLGTPSPPFFFKFLLYLIKEHIF